MSYVDLKHLLADLALEATRRPEEASWAPLLAAYGMLADSQRPAVPWTTLRDQATRVGARFGWIPTNAALAHLVGAHLLEEHEGLVSVRPPFVPHLPYLRRQTSRLVDVLADLAEGTTPRTVPDELRRGVALFNAGLFFECHEYLEGLWRATSGPEKDFYHGIVQVAAAFYHYEKRNPHGARTLFGKGLQRLERYPTHYLGINLTAFLDALQPWVASVAARALSGGPQQPYPRITCLES